MWLHIQGEKWASEKWPGRKSTLNFLILRPNNPKFSIGSKSLLGSDTAVLNAKCLTPQEGPAPPLHWIHTHVGPAPQCSQHFSAAPQPDPTRNTALTFVKHISWCDARAFTWYQTQTAIQGKFFWSFLSLQIMSLRVYL